MVKQKIHPTTDTEILNLLKKYGLKPPQALEEYACFLATNSIKTVLEETMLKERKTELLQEKQETTEKLANIDKKLETIDMKLDRIHELKKEFIPVGSKNFDEALHIIITRIRAIIELEEKGKWDLKKIPFKEVLMICSYQRVPVESVLARIPDNMKKYISGYVAPSSSEDTSETPQKKVTSNFSVR